MRRVSLPVVLGISIALLLGLAVATEAGSCPEGQSCVRVPNVKHLSTANTPTSTIAVTPADSGSCSASAPAPAEGLQAWFVPDNSHLLCTRLFVESRPVQGLPWQAMLHTAQRTVALTIGPDSFTYSAPSATRINAAVVSGEAIVSIDVAMRYLDTLYRVTLPPQPTEPTPVLWPTPPPPPAITVVLFHKEAGAGKPVAVKVYVSQGVTPLPGAAATMQIGSKTFTLADVGGGYYAACAVGSFDGDAPPAASFSVTHQGSTGTTSWAGGSNNPSGSCP
ncbi:MAG TPA: hypothetical protein VFS21_37890 [Roseiflexaceae bacterium]|nr:hypothetical protein [Roseiflexaceae bacterium]